MTWSWALYQDADGNIPEDLLAFFVRIIPDDEKPVHLPKPTLSASETRTLQVNLVYLCDRGLASLNSDKFEKLEADLYELRLRTESNPRFILTAVSPQCFVILHGFKKKYNGAFKERDKEPARIRLKELQNRKNNEKL
jgi:phage-related protein